MSKEISEGIATTVGMDVGEVGLEEVGPIVGSFVRAIVGLFVGLKVGLIVGLDVINGELLVGLLVGL